MVKSNPQDGLERNGQVNNYKGHLRMILQRIKQGLKDKFRAYKIKRLNSRKRVAPGAYKLANVFGQSIDQIIVKMFSESKTHNKKKISTLYVMSDEDFFVDLSKRINIVDKNPIKLVNVQDHLIKSNINVSHLFEVELEDNIGIVVGGKTVNVFWPQVLRFLHHEGHNKPVFDIEWVSENWEMAFGTLAFPPEIKDVDISIFHHWSSFAGMKEHILASITIFDESTEKCWKQILAPQETINIRLNDILPIRTGASGIKIQTFHPKLIGRRNHRWRPFADVLTENSITSLHGAHELPKPNSTAQFIVDIGSENVDKLTVTLPNYEKDLPEGCNQTTYKLCDRNMKIHEEVFKDRQNHKLIDCIQINLEERSGQNLTQCRIKSKGSGGSFWYNYKNTKKTDCISANHTVSSPYEKVEPKKLPPDEYIKSLESSGILIYPYPVPVTQPNNQIEFGFNFLCSQPEFYNYKALLMNSDGKKISETDFIHKGKSHCMTSDILDTLEEEVSKNVSMILVVPDWIKEGLRPYQVRVDGLLIAKHRTTEDYDITEFQNSWRNLGIRIPSYKHWLLDNMMLTGRTNLRGRINYRAELRNGVLLINSSGRLNYSTKAIATIQIVGSNGASVGCPIKVSPHGFNLVWIDELFPNLKAILDNSPATVLVTCCDCDINGHMITLRGNKAVALQHMWGY